MFFWAKALLNHFIWLIINSWPLNFILFFIIIVVIFMVGIRYSFNRDVICFTCVGTIYALACVIISLNLFELLSLWNLCQTLFPFFFSSPEIMLGNGLENYNYYLSRHFSNITRFTVLSYILLFAVALKNSWREKLDSMNSGD